MRPWPADVAAHSHGLEAVYLKMLTARADTKYEGRRLFSELLGPFSWSW
jgi:hypothetical protein